MRKATIFCAMMLMVVVATAPTEDEERAIEAAIERASLQPKYLKVTNKSASEFGNQRKCVLLSFS